MSTMSALAMLGLILLVLGVYWLPSILARIWRHPDLVSIVVVNALLGWTVVGWVWAVSRLVRERAGHRLQLAPAAATTAGGDPGGWQPADAREADLRTVVGSAASPGPLEP
ncbi:MAG: superinfection immunity protein [Streptosporangiaceae bacterium]